jgi:tetratricopeptide (TPR) repeat protein
MAVADHLSTPLANWNRAIELALHEGKPEAAARLAQVVLRRMPRHLLTYYRLLQATWMLKRWEEGEDWAKRLLQADPCNALAWRALAQASEQRGKRSQAHAIWQRAFEMNPYEPEIRAGLNRTNLDEPNVFALNLACLGAIYVRGGHWEHAAAVYRTLVKADPRRVDFQIYLMLALWQTYATQEAYALARHLVQTQQRLLLAWVVLDAAGDENDQALARSPLETLDPGGDFVPALFPILYPQRAATIVVTTEEARWLERYTPTAKPSAG